MSHGASSARDEPRDHWAPATAAATDTRAYHGLRLDNGRCVVTCPDGALLELAPSLALIRHSRTGWEWGYLGSGPAQLALALLLDHLGNAHAAIHWHQAFKHDFVSTWRRDSWVLPVEDLRRWIGSRPQ